MINFGERLRLLRTRKGLSQLDFAKQIKISKSAVNMYERGEREPSFEVLETIADYFNVDLDYLLGKTDCENKNRIAIQSHFEITDYERTLIEKFRKLDDRGQAAVINGLDHEYDSLPGEKADSLTKEA